MWSLEGLNLARTETDEAAPGSLGVRVQGLG